jgi:ATP-dependent DNA helicase Q1
VSALAYHANMDSTHRSRVHERWLSDQVRVIVATIAFGMGIDKPNVRFVIHHSLSKSLENFYQESGRAGRDGLPAASVLFFRFSDVFRQSSMVFTEQTGLLNLYSMVNYCVDETSCKRALIARHFDQDSKSACHSIDCPRMCDSCRSGAQANNERDCLNECNLVLEVVRRQEKNVTANKLSELTQSEIRKKLKGSDFTLAHTERLILHMLMRELLREDFHFTPYSTICYLVAGRRAPDVATGRLTKFFMPLTQQVNTGKRMKAQDLDENEFDSKKKKKVKTNSEHHEVYVVDDSFS